MTEIAVWIIMLLCASPNCNYKKPIEGKMPYSSLERCQDAARASALKQWLLHNRTKEYQWSCEKVIYEAKEIPAGKRNLTDQHVVEQP